MAGLGDVRIAARTPPVVIYEQRIIAPVRPACSGCMAGLGDVRIAARTPPVVICDNASLPRTPHPSLAIWSAGIPARLSRPEGPPGF